LSKGRLNELGTMWQEEMVNAYFNYYYSERVILNLSVLQIHSHTHILIKKPMYRSTQQYKIALNFIRIKKGILQNR
jgi:hypothetical protein